ncbi:MAG: hypothetical protein ABL908_15990 [Hyphomicrobium sp.]
MATPTTHWRISPVAWVPISLAIVAESVSNALRAYGLGTHLDRFTVVIQGHPVSIAGAVLVLAAIAVSLSQARAAWVALTPSGPVRQRIVAGTAAVLLLSISITAMASHILEAQRAKVSDEGGARGRYDRAKAAYDTAAAELAKLGNPRPVPVIQAEVQSTKIDMSVWRRSQQCADISRDDTRAACEPILKLYKERGAAARKAELEPEVSRLRGELGKLDRPAEATTSEDAVSGIWAWIMGLGVVFVATFGTVIFASVAPARTAPAAADTRQTSFPAIGGDPEGSGGPSPGRPLPAPLNENAPAVAKGQVIAWAREYEGRTGRPPSWSELRQQFALPKSTASVWRRQACG